MLVQRNFVHLIFLRRPFHSVSPKLVSRRMSTQNIKIRLDEFAMRQFDDPNYVGTRILMDKKEFMDKVNELVKSAKLADGYAPFCKHIFIPNFVKGLKVGAMEITPDNVHKVRSGYKARTEKELPVLVRWFPREEVSVPDAKFLDLILYSREQVIKENEAMGNPVSNEDYDWGLISIKGQLEDFETPMTPITALRNALGKEEGGSGVPIDREKYMQAVEYWEKHAAVV